MNSISIIVLSLNGSSLTEDESASHKMVGVKIHILTKLSSMGIFHPVERPYRLGARTPDSHSGNRGSIPLRAVLDFTRLTIIPTNLLLSQVNNKSTWAAVFPRYFPTVPFLKILPNCASPRRKVFISQTTAPVAGCISSARPLFFFQIPNPQNFVTI